MHFVVGERFSENWQVRRSVNELLLGGWQHVFTTSYPPIEDVMHHGQPERHVRVVLG